MEIDKNIDFGEYIELVGELEAQEIHSADYWREKILERLDGRKIHGDTLPWSKTQNEVRLRSGELSIWAGMNGHRKSMILGQVMVHLARKSRVAIASLEMYPEETLFRMCCQSSGVAAPSAEYTNKWIDWAADKIVIYDQLDKVAGEKILGFIHYSAKVLGCKHIVVDSLTKLGLLNDDQRNGEKDLINRLQWAAKTLKCHIHLVAHIRKPSAQGEEYRPNKFDVRGAGELVDLADNCFLVWKDKGKETAIQKQEAGIVLSDKELRSLERPDQILTVAKQRHGAFEGGYGFWFHESMQFMERENSKVVMVDL